MKNKLTSTKKNIIQFTRLPAIMAGCGLVLLALTPSALAQTAYVSSASGNFSTATIWTPNGTPGPSDTVEITGGTLVTNTGSAASVGSVTIDTAGTFALNASMTVGTLTNKGTLNLNANTTGRTLTLNGNFANTGSITGNSSGLDTIQFGNTSVTSLWLGSGDLSGAKCLIAVSAGAALDVSGLTSPIKFRSTGTMMSIITGTLMAGAQVLNGNGNASCSFKLAAGGTLFTANPNGIVNGAIGTLNFATASTFDLAANYVFNGTAAQVTTGLPAAVNNLTVTNAAGVTLNAAIAINGTLALNGGVLTTTSGATPTAAAVSSTSGSYVSGPLALIYPVAGSQTFPIGKGGNERPVTLNYTALTGSSTVTVEQFEAAMGGTVPPSTTQFNSRYWTVSQTGGSGLTYNLTVNGTGFSPAATPVILQQGTPDTSYSASVSAPNYTASGITTVGSFTLGDYVPSASQLAFTTSVQTLTAGVTSGTMTVQLQNSGNAPLNTTTNLTVLLSTTSGGGVFRDPGDTTTITSVTILAGNNSASFKYKDTAAPGTPTLTASVSGANPATQTETINPAAANKLAFTTQPASTNVNVTMAPVVAQVQDQYGNPVAQSGTAITLTLNNGGSSVLTGTIPQNTDGSGAATFSDLAVTTAPGLGLTLTATGGSLTAAISGSFNITPQIIVKALNNTALDQGPSWTGGVEPGVNDLAQINDSSVSTSVNSPDVGAGVSWYGLRITGWNASHGYTVTDFGGSDVLTLGSGGLTGTSVTHTIAFNCPLALATNEVWDWSGTGGTLTFNNIVDNGGYQLTLGGNQPITVSSLGGGMTGAGSLVKQGSDTLTLAGSQDYTGTTVVSNGTLLVSGTLSASSAVTVAGGTLTGNGSISSPVTVQSGGIFAPGGGLTTLTLSSNLTLQAGSQTKVSVNRDTPANDQAAGISQANYGGTLVVNNLAGSPSQVGDTFTLFSTASYSGNFGSISGTPGTGLAWSFNPTNGMLSVVNGTATNPTNITFVVLGNTLTLSWPADHLGWILQSQTNTLNVGNWFDVAGSSSATNAVITINPANPAVFFRLRSP
jgi:autotransporter-associated beta strand protein